MINLVTSFIRISRFSYWNVAFENMEHQHVSDNTAFNGASAYQYYMQQQCIYSHHSASPR